VEFTSPNFTTNGDIVKILWDVEISQTNGWLDIKLYHSDGTFYARRTISGIYSTFTTDVIIEDPGSYYITTEMYMAHYYEIFIWDYH